MTLGCHMGRLYLFIVHWEIAFKHLHALSLQITNIFCECECTRSFVCDVEKGSCFCERPQKGSWWRHRLSDSLTGMTSYTVTVATGSQWFAGTDDYIYLTLVGTDRCSEKTLLDKPLYNDFERGAVRCLSICWKVFAENIFNSNICSRCQLVAGKIKKK